MPDTIGRRIAQRRKMLSLSQEALGEHLGVSRQAISKWEADTSIPELDRLMDMSKLFDVSLDWLISGEDNPPPEETSADLTDTITQTLQPPLPQDTPEPAPSEPPKPRKEPSHLPMLACVGLTIASLLLSLLCLTRTPQQPADTTTNDEAQLQSQIDTLKEEVTALTHTLTDLETSSDQAWERSYIVSKQLIELENKLDLLAEEIQLAPGLPVVLPSYESLATWSIDTETSDDLSTVTICFRCVPVSETASVQLQIYQADQLFQSVDCPLVDHSYQCRAPLPSENGYRYVLLMEQPDGSIERLTLEGHGLSDLADLTKPRLYVTHRGSPVFLSSDCDRFLESFSHIRLQIPILTPDSPQIVWSGLWLSHYKNGEFLEEFSLMEEMSDQEIDLTDHILRFRILTTTFQTDGVQEGDTHQITLEGKLEVNGRSIPFSFYLLDLTYQNGKLISTND